MPNPVRSEKARLAANMRHHPDQDHTDNRRDLAAANLEQYVRKVVAKAPPLSDEQRDRIASLLRAGGGVS